MRSWSDDEKKRILLLPFDWFHEKFSLLSLVTEFFLLNLSMCFEVCGDEKLAKKKYLNMIATNNWGRAWANKSSERKRRKIISIHKKQIYQKHRLDWIYRSLFCVLFLLLCFPSFRDKRNGYFFRRIGVSQGTWIPVSILAQIKFDRP